MLGYDDVVNAQPAVFTGLADQWERLATTLAGHHDQWRSQVDAGLPPDAWTGQASAAARTHISQLTQGLAGHEQPLRQVSATLRQAAQDVAGAQARLTQARQQAGALGLVVGPGGAVTIDPTRITGNTADLPVVMASAELLSREITGAVRSANDADQRAAAALDALAPTGGGPASARDTAATHPASTAPAAAGLGRTAAQVARNAVPPDAPAGADPAGVKQWWDGLPQERKKEYAQKFPGYVGSTDGIPSAVRDYANRRNLATLIQRTRQDLDDLRKNQPTPFFGEPPASFQARQQQWLRQVEDLETKTAGMERLRQNLGPANGGPGYADGFPTTDIPQTAADFRTTNAPKFLLQIDTAGTGHMIVASNNPDAAQNVATVVPGVTSKLDEGNATFSMNYSENFLKAAAAKGAGPTAVIWWDNYDAPDSAASVDAATSGSAEQGAPKLNQFEQGLQATRNPGSDAHNVLIGHSYGSVVVGNAARGAGGVPFVDDIVAIGSPGMDVGKAADLHVPPGDPARDPGHPHVWASTTQWDMIRTTVIGHNNNPDNQDFGATVFDSGPGPGNPVEAHNYYWDPNSAAMANMGAIIAGDYQAVTRRTW